MQQEAARKILATSFTTPDGGSRAAGALGGAMRDKIGNTAVLFVRPDGKAKFVESKDWGAGRGALLGGAVRLIGGATRVGAGGRAGSVAGGTIGALVSKLRDSGFKNDQLEQLGKSLQPNTSAIVVEIAGDATDTGAGGRGRGGRAVARCRLQARAARAARQVAATQPLGGRGRDRGRRDRHGEGGARTARR